MADALIVLLQFLGLGLIACGLFMLTPWIGIVAAGAALLILGYLMEGGKTDGST